MPPVELLGEDEVVHPGDAEHGVVNAVAFQAAVAENLPGLHVGEDVLDAGSDLAVRAVVFCFPGREFGPGRLQVPGSRRSSASSGS